jgi:hypothetical protein
MTRKRAGLRDASAPRSPARFPIAPSRNEPASRYGFGEHRSLGIDIEHQSIGRKDMHWKRRFLVWAAGVLAPVGATPDRPHRPLCRQHVCLIALLLAMAQQSAQASQDLTDLPLEQLMNESKLTDASVFGASRFRQRVSTIPSAVTVISREDIQQYGWRTVAEALRSVPGFYVHSDRSYNYIGARGFARPQDYNSRVLLLIDGQRTNDAVYDTAYVGTEQLIDIDLVERIEVVRGPGSSVYGGNALFGVINIITRTAQQIDGVEIGAAYSSFSTVYGRATFGKRLDNGAEIVASVSGSDSHGPDLRFPEFDAPETSFGRTSGTAFDRSSRFYARLHLNAGKETGIIKIRSFGNFRVILIIRHSYFEKAIFIYHLVNTCHQIILISIDNGIFCQSFLNCKICITNCATIFLA